MSKNKTGKKALRKLANKIGDRAAKAANESNFRLGALIASNKSARRLAKSLYRFQPTGDKHGVVDPDAYRRPAPYLGDQKPLPPVKRKDSGK